MLLVLLRLQVFGHRSLPLRHAMLKLLSVKAIVFFIFWQGVISTEGPRD